MKTLQNLRSELIENKFIQIKKGDYAYNGLRMVSEISDNNINYFSEIYLDIVLNWAGSFKRFSKHNHIAKSERKLFKKFVTKCYISITSKRIAS